MRKILASLSAAIMAAIMCFAPVTVFANGVEAVGTTMYGLPKPNVLDVVPEKQIRVIMDGDMAAEFDDMFAVTYALISPKLEVVGLCAGQWGTDKGSVTSMQDSYDELVKLTDAMGIQGVPICHGAADPITQNEDGTYTYESNEASDLIYQEAMKEDSRPLVVCVTGAMTNVAIAYLEHPEIADQNFYIIGNENGSVDDPHRWSFNLGHDYVAANICLDSNMTWYAGNNTGQTNYRISSTDLYLHLKKAGSVGEYLWNRALDQYESLRIRIGENMKQGQFGGGNMDALQYASFYPNGEILETSDMSKISRVLTLGYCKTEDVDAGHLLPPGVEDDHEPVRQIKQFTNPLDINCCFNDFFAKLEYYFGE